MAPRQRKRLLAMIHCELMTGIQKLLLVLEELVKRRLAGIEGSRELIH